MNNLLSLAQSEPGISILSSHLDRDDHLFGVENGIIDLRKNELVNPSADIYITKCSRATYDPEAPCPRWTQFIEEITGGDNELGIFLQQLVGYCLAGGNPEQMFVVLYGHGANGKSTFLSVLNWLLGEYCRTVDPSLFMVRRFQSSGGPREDIVRLQGARLISTSEVGDGQVLDEDMVKRMTGDDILTGRVPYGRHSVEFRPNFCPIMVTNHKPIIRGEDHAIWRRIRLVPFEQKFDADKRDKHLTKRLTAELSGILNWALEGYRQYLKSGLTIPRCISNATVSYRTEMDLFQEWIEDMCVIGENERCNTADLYGSFHFYHDGDRLVSSITKKAFGRKLSDRGFISCKIRGSRGWRGIRLKTEMELLQDRIEARK
ncbi:hypothetical protein BOW51_11790 [Solemya velesiana gill symbiont]|uniref:SF3 helicase domain-containing protein n=1 Tax=Solemya velesiana gill symbiont TaxID=1918948 RepID=A0A1T2KPY7_9GAMM|nr:hypothetical protein BOW51_11790 [Solemya velesiana gill symbiont]